MNRLTFLACTLFFLAMAEAIAQPSATNVATPQDARARSYPAAKQGGNYMYNFYLPPAPSSTPWAPAWAPDGKTIAVGLYGSIWSIDPESGLAKELTYGSSYHSSPAWSPDGNWIVYTADYDHKRIQLEALHVATGRVVNLTDDQELLRRSGILARR